MNISSIPLNISQVSTRQIDLAVYSCDASFYRYKPQAITFPKSVSDIVAIIDWCKHNNSHLNFRGAGTSLSGQAITDGIIIDLKRNINKVKISSDGKFATAEPGAIEGHVNDLLQSYSYVLGPDPASINACTIGGIVANNSSGMSSGNDKNPYNTIESLVFVLSNGMIFDSSDLNSNDRLKIHCPDIFFGLERLRTEIHDDCELKNKIIDSYKLKNTIGYSLNAFLDFEKPIDILTHLLVGSEGTLGFISSATFRTFPLRKHKHTRLIFFADLNSACSAINKLNESKPFALELMDFNSLLSIKSKSNSPKFLAAIPENSSALLLEYQEENENNLNGKIEIAENFITENANIVTWIEAKTKEEYNAIWSVRKGLLASLGGTKAPRTTFILEDLCLPLETFSESISGLQDLLVKYEYINTGIYGHGLDGNVHFMLTQDFEEPDAVMKLENFMNDLADLVVDKFVGSLKAEHGTGRNMAPFVEKQWGTKAYMIMQRIKKLLDPDNILNPGVIINDDTKIHLKNIKSYPVINEKVDKCIECGFCEPKCPSRDLTLTPRKRIILERELERTKNSSTYGQILADYKYYSNDTCALDSLCSSVCPIGINTGDLIKRHRIEEQPSKNQKIAKFISNHFGIFENIIKSAIFSAQIIQDAVGEKSVNSIIRFFEKISGLKIYRWYKEIPYPAKIVNTISKNSQFIYFPCCVSRMMGKTEGKKSIIETMLSVAEKCGIKIHIPADISNYCCGTVFSSKGFNEGFVASINKTISEFWEWSYYGKLPIVVDSSSCFHTLKNCRQYLNVENSSRFDKLDILDSLEFANIHLLPKIRINQKKKNVILHPTCSSILENNQILLEKIAEICSEEVIIPSNAGCCGTAGDRGLLFPELTESATKGEAFEVSKITADGYYSSNIPCEVGMSHSTGKHYESFLYLLDEVIK